MRRECCLHMAMVLSQQQDMRPAITARWLQAALGKLRAMQRSAAASPTPRSLQLPEIASTATSDALRGSANVVSYGERMRAIEAEQQRRGLSGSQVDTACVTPSGASESGRVGVRSSAVGRGAAVRSTTELEGDVDDIEEQVLPMLTASFAGR
jgi:hypothetical protein